MSARPLLALTLGDPAGIGPEIVLRLLAGAGLPARLLLVGDAGALDRARKHVPAAPAVPTVEHPEALAGGRAEVALLGGMPGLDPLPPLGQIDARAGAASHEWVLAAADLARAGRVDGMVTGPIHKEAWHAAGVESPGHTEALRDRAAVDHVQMLFVAERLRVALATIHIPLREVPDRVRSTQLTADLRLLAAGLTRFLGIPRPRLAVCGVNPHAGEGGLFGTEDAEQVQPAVAAARSEGIDAVGPLPADACIPAAVAGAYDGVLAMYHDQALPAVKALAPRAAVNVTLGLPFIRTSVDHGTAFDIASAGCADESSLRVAVELAARMTTTGRRDA